MRLIKDIKIDPEYSAVWKPEVQYLTKHGIDYVFTKDVNGLIVWKYKKTPELFEALADFYSNVYSK